MVSDYLYGDIFARNILLWGAEAQQKLRDSRVALIGLGGVGSYVAEALARSGIGALILCDYDQVELSNINRQLPALHSTLSRPKIEAVAERLADINPCCQLTLLTQFITPDNVQILGEADYFIDAIDHLPGKLAIIEYALALGRPVASSMGVGKRLAPELLRLADISQSKGCPLARELRRRLRAQGIVSGVTVVYSEETPREAAQEAVAAVAGGKKPLPSSPCVPAAAGLLLASAVIRDLAGLGR